jgi:cytochrome b subunit of formate dehydrogenase
MSVLILVGMAFRVLSICSSLKCVFVLLVTKIKSCKIQRLWNYLMWNSVINANATYEKLQKVFQKTMPREEAFHWHKSI